MDEEIDIEQISYDLERISDIVEFDHSSEIKQFKRDIKKLNEDLNIWNLFEDKMIPYRYEKYLNKSIINLRDTPYKDRINCLIKKSNNFDIPSPLTQKKFDNKIWRKNKILRCTTFLKNSNEFFNTARNSSIDTQPIFYYYGMSYLFSFLIESFIDFNKPRKHHGIFVNSKGDVNKITFKYSPNGFFQRLVHSLTILQYPSSFSSFMTDFDNNKYSILKEISTAFTISNKNEISMNDLINHDFVDESYNANFGIINYIDDFQSRYQAASNIIRDFLLIYISSSVARYDPKLWRQIYSGEETDLILNIKKSFENTKDMIRFINRIILDTENGEFVGADKNLDSFF